MDSEFYRGTLRAMVKSFYDAQKLRIETGNRIVANVRVKMGQDPGAKTEEITDEGQALLKTILFEYKRLTDGLIKPSSRSISKAIEVQKGVITDLFEYELIGYYSRLLDSEEQLGKGIAHAVKLFPIWDVFLKNVKGCGPAMAAVCISELDPHKARHISSYWKYAGLDVAGDGKGRSRKKEHLVEVDYTNKDGEASKRVGITFNPFLKTKLVGVLGSCFLRSGGDYKLIYEGYKHRLECREEYKDDTKGHRHNMAIRYMIKMFLKDLWLEMRKIEGLPVTQDYAEAKLGLNHKSA